MFFFLNTLKEWFRQKVNKQNNFFFFNNFMHDNVYELCIVWSLTHQTAALALDNTLTVKSCIVLERLNFSRRQDRETLCISLKSE